MEQVMPGINKRLQEVVTMFSGGNVANFAKSIGVVQQRFDRLFRPDSRNGKYPKVPDDIIESTLKTYEVCKVWLLTGEGNMLKSNNNNNQVVPLLDNTIMHIPLVSKYAYAGYLNSFGDDDYLDTLPTIPFVVDHTGKGQYICFEIKGDSMDDGTIHGYIEGEIILCREIPFDYWTQNKIHINHWDFVIVHKTEGILIKEIAMSNPENKTITLHSRNPYYSDITLNISDIQKIFNVISSQKPRRK